MSMRSVTVPYGKDQITIDIPEKNLMGVFTPKSSMIASDELQLIIEALEHPVGTPRLRELVQPDMQVIIIADDKTRPTPVDRILPLLLDELSAGGVSDDNISVVFALGTHTPMTQYEMEVRAGYAGNRIKLYNSEFRDPAGLKDYGTAPDGVRVLIDKRVAEADFKIAVGSIMPHPECGWGGGGKIIYPGVASEETVTTFHLSYAHVDWNSYGSDKAPVRLNMEQWVDTVGLDFIVNTVITADNRVYQTVAGHYIAAHRKGIEYGRQIYTVTLPERPDIVLITSYRADEDFWLASKAIYAGELVMKDGGTMILVTPCPDGIGPHPAYAEYVGNDQWSKLTCQAFAGEIEEPIAVSSAVAIAKMRQRFNISIVSSGLTAYDVEKMQCSYYATIEDALNIALRKHGPNATIAVLPDGINTIPQVAE